MKNISLWMKTSDQPHTYPTLEKNIEVDVAIIGGGITGFTTAFECLQAGQSVAVIEALSVGTGTTGFSTGNLYIPVQPYYQHIAEKFNLETAEMIAASRHQTIDYIENIVKENNINCQFHRRPWFLFTNDENKIKFLEKEIETLKKIKVDIQETNDLLLNLPFKKAGMIANQARLHPLRYVIALADLVHQKGCKIFENTRVISIDEGKEICTLHTSEGILKAKHVCIATHTPIGFNVVQTFTAPYRSYVVTVNEPGKAYPEGQWWDLSNPHHALCTHAINGNQPDLLMVAGSHHKTGQGESTSKHYEELAHYLHQHFPHSQPVCQWSAQHYQSADDVPYIGLAHRFAKRTYMATGYFADGLVYGTLSGIILAKLIQKKEEPLAKTYQANRFKPLASATFLLKQNMNVLLQYLKDYTKTRTHQFDDIKKGEGKVVKVKGEKCAVSRDDNDQLHVVSAVCTHMKCIVHWNQAEKTWDCPCHGSRFTSQGKVIEGPAVSDLEKKEV